jgi:hypothetical protein
MKPKKLLKVFFALSATVVLVSLCSVVLWYSIAFLPHLHNLQRLVQEGERMLTGVPGQLYTLAVAAEGKDGIRSFGIKRAYWELVYKHKRTRISRWHLGNALWHISSYIHFDDEEMFRMWANFAPYEEGQGFAGSASYYFNKPLVDLTTKEYATLVAVVKSPNMFKPGTARGDKRIKRVIAIAETYNSGSHADAENFRAGETGR